MSINLKAGILGILKRSRREVNQSNQEQGKSGESQAKAKWEMNGWKMTRTGTGHDYRATRKNWRTGKTETKYVEVKTGNSPLSPLQKKKKKQLGSKYVEERIDSNPLIGYGRSIFFGSDNSNQQKKKPTNSSSNIGIIDMLFGTNSSSRTTKSSRRSKSKRSSGVSLWGTSKPTRKSKRSSGVSLWGTSTPSRRSKSCGRSNVDKIWGSGSDSVSIW